MNDTKFYIKELKRDECQCGRPKKPGFSLCYKCYSALPKDMQRDLYLSIWDGYGEALDAAIHYLNS